jgi:pyochelin synthetase
MSATELVDHLRSIGVQLWVDGENLRFRAPRDVLGADLKAALKAAKPDVIALLADETAPLRAPRQRFEPFPLTDVQAAYLVGRTSAFRWGGVGCHGYAEFAVDHAVARPGAEHYRAAWRAVVDRHDMLSAVVHPDGYQRIDPDGTDGLTIYESAAAEQTAERRAGVAHELRHRSYRLGQAPMYDLVVTIGPHDTVVHVSIDLLIADFVSISLLMTEFEQRLTDPDYDPPALGFSFREYLLNLMRERDSAAGADRRRRDLHYWQTRLGELPPPMRLPTLPDDETQTTPDDAPRFSRRSTVLASDRFAALGTSAAHHGVTASVAVLAALGRIIGRYGDRDHFLLTLTTMDRRPFTPDVAGLVGDFTGTSVLEVDAREPATFAETARTVGERLFDDMDHASIDGVDIARLLARAGDDRGEQSPVVFTSTLGAGHRRGGQALLHPIDGRGLSQTPQVLLDCQAAEFDGALQLNWDTRDGVIAPEVLDAAFTDFCAALQELSTDAGAWQRPLPAPVAPEPTVTDGPRSHHRAALLHAGFAARAAGNPEAVAVRHGDRAVSYGQLLAAATAVAAELSATGVGRGDYVGIQLPAGASQVAAILGVLLAGAAYIPLDVEWPDHRVEQIVAQSSPATLCRPGGRVEALLADEATWTPRPAAPFDGPAGEHDTAYVIFTSGSTGAPKGVMMAHDAVVNTITDINDRLGIGAHDSVLAVSQHTFDLSVYNIFGVLAAGGALVFPDAAGRTDPQSWHDAIRDHRVSIWNSVPAQMQLLLDQHDGTDTLGSLRRIMLSGDWIAPSQPAQIAAAAPGASVLSLGGATEAAIWSICHPVTAGPYHRSVPYGTAMRNQSVRVLTHRGEPAAPWQVGELYIGGLGLAQGYLGDPQRTASSFITHRLSGERLYRTGDYGRVIDGGVIEFLGRRDNQVKVRGHRIELAEVDSALSCLPGVGAAHSAVVGDRPHEPILAAAVVPETATDDEITERAAVAAAVRRAVTAAHDGQVAGLDVDGLDRFATTARAVAIDAMCAALGTVDEPGQRVAVDELARRLSLPDGLGRLLGRWIDALTETGAALRHPGPAIELTEARDLADCGQRWQRVRQLGAEIGYGDELLAYVGDCIGELPGLLAGAVDPLALLFPEGTVDTATAAYRDNLLARYTNAVVVAAVAERARHATADRALRVLEIGAGVGGTTADLIAALAGHHVRYTFTDISTFFLTQAAEAFAGHDFLDYRLFDINEPPGRQGLAPASFDVIVAANVLHNAVNVDETLTMLESLLAPGGSLVFIDATATNHPLMISMEFKEGLHGFTDARANTNSAFLGHAQWAEALARSPLQQVCAFPPADHPLGRLGQHVFCCDSGSTRQALRPAQLTDAARRVLPGSMIPQQLIVLPATPLTGNGKIDRAAITGALEELRAAARSPQSAIGGASTGLDPMQHRVAAIWASVLQLPAGTPLSPTSDFFVLGGDSLLMAQAIGRIRREIDEAAELAWDDLLRAMVSDPSLAAAAAAIDPTGRAGPPAADGGAGGPESPLTYLGAGQGFKPGEEIAVLVHDGSGGLAPYEQLIAALRTAGAGLPELYGLRRVAGDGYLTIAPPELFTTLADRYAAAVTALRPARVHLVGYCMGGLLATEIAKRLDESGIQTAGVTVVSSYRVPTDIEDDDVLDYCFAQIMGVAPAELGMPVDDDAIRDTFAAAQGRYRDLIPAGALRDAAGPALAAGLQRSAPPGEPRMRLLAQSAALGRSWNAETLGDLRAIFVHSLRAVVHGATEPFLGDLHFLRQRGEIHFLPTLQDDMTDFWHDYCLGELSITEIDGNHFDCLTGANAHSVAGLLRDSWATR